MMYTHIAYRTYIYGKVTPKLVGMFGLTPLPGEVTRFKITNIPEVTMKCDNNGRRRKAPQLKDSRERWRWWWKER